MQLNDFCHDLSQLKSPEDFLEGQMIMMDKPLDWTSFDLVKKIRAKLQHGLKLKKIKVGHAGTLDPLATGLVIVCIGKATKKIDALMAWEKTYEARIRFGATTPSFDLETEPDQEFPAGHINKDKINETLKSFLGEQAQVPPHYSAIKMGGRRAYDMIRGGEEFDMVARKVFFHDLELLGYEDLEATIKIVCSKGTYIRSFARDLGLALNSGAFMSGLRRTGIGPADVEKALTVEDIEHQLKVLKEDLNKA